MEMFSDEMHARCRKCGVRVERESAPSCIQWCKAARQCLGEERWKRAMGLLRGGKESGRGARKEEK